MGTWVEIEGFYNYEINRIGDVRHINYKLTRRDGEPVRKDTNPVKPSMNQYGVVQIGLYYEGKTNRRSVAVLVAKAFLEPPRWPHYNTVIHLDGDKENCEADNLAWRPRRYAINYHRQFEHVHSSFLEFPVEIIETGEIFDRSIDCCMKYGVLAEELLQATYNEDLVWMLGYHVRVP
jgi:HNH endonuclease